MLRVLGKGSIGFLWKFGAPEAPCGSLGLHGIFMEVRVRGSLGLSGSLGLGLCQGFW